MRRMPIAVMLVAVLMLPGCTTLGLPILGSSETKDREQAAIEGASMAMAFKYMEIRESDMSLSDMIKTLLDTGDSFIKALYPEYSSYAEVVELRIGDVTKGKFTPQVGTIYYFVNQALEAIAEPEAELEPLVE